MCFLAEEPEEPEKLWKPEEPEEPEELNENRRINVLIRRSFFKGLYSLERDTCYSLPVQTGLFRPAGADRMTAIYWLKLKNILMMLTAPFCS